MTLNRKNDRNNLPQGDFGRMNPNSYHYPDLLGPNTRDLNYIDQHKNELLKSWEDFQSRRPHLARLLVELFGPISVIEIHKEVNPISEVRAAGAVGNLRPLKQEHRDISNVSES